MAVYLHQAQRSLRQVNVVTRDRYTIPFQLPDGYNDKGTHYIGSGTYGIVIRTHVVPTCMNPRRERAEMEAAIKKINRPMESMRMAQLCYRELMLLKNLDHPNIARLVDMYTSARHPNELLDVYLVMEYVGSSLDAQLAESIKDKYAYVPMTSIPRVIHDTLRALEYLMHAEVLHRDLKPANLAVHPTGRAVLIDFGLARTGIIEEDRSSPFTKKTGTMAYAAPEVIFWEEASYDRRADIWSLGCIIAEIITWEPLFSDVKSKVSLYISMFQPISDQFLSKVSTSDGAKGYIEKKNKTLQRENLQEYFLTKNKVANFRNQKDVDALDLFWKCVKYDPELRISINDALRHPFLADIYNPEDHRNVRNVQPLVYNDTRNSIEEWKQAVFGEICSGP